MYHTVHTEGCLNRVNEQAGVTLTGGYLPQKDYQIGHHVSGKGVTLLVRTNQSDFVQHLRM